MIGQRRIQNPRSIGFASAIEAITTVEKRIKDLEVNHELLKLIKIDL